MSIVVEKLLVKDFETKYGTNTLGHHRYVEGIHFIDLPVNASTHTRLHELAHAKLGHGEKDSRLTWKEIIDSELSAEIQAWKWKSKELNWRVALSTICMLKEESKFSKVSTLFNLLNNSFSRLGYKLSTKDEKEMWNYLRNSNRRKL